MRAPRLRDGARRLANVTPADIALAARAFAMLVRMRIALWLLPWRRVLAKTGSYSVFGTRETTRRVSIDRLERSVRTASRVVPRATCLTQALALTHLLARTGYTATVRIGVTNSGGRFAAHAWVECEGMPLLSSAADVARYAPLVAWTPAHPDVFR